MTTFRDFFDYRWNPVLFLIFSYNLWITGIWKAWRKDVKAARKLKETP